MDRPRQPRVRFAPSPTGYLHIGSARTALFNWLYARKHNGTFVLRIEDTDTARNTPEALRAIMDGLAYLGLEPDEGPYEGPYGPYFQSRRGHLYAEAIEELKKSDGIYSCFCTRERLRELRERQGQWRYDGRCRALAPQEVSQRLRAGEPHTWRLKVTRPGRTSFNDLILGPTSVDHEDVEDIVLVRADGSPTYNLAVVIDDHYMKITHVIRGQDHLTNSFKQILIYRTLGWEVPQFAHISLILAPPPHTGKLSKRHGGAAVRQYQEKGYHPEALVNWLALIGWSFGEDRGILTREELITHFDMARAGKAHARVNFSKLNALSGHWIRAQKPEEYRRKILPYLLRQGFLNEEAPDAQQKLSLMAEMTQPRVSYYAQVTEILLWAKVPYPIEADALKALRKTPQAAEFLPAYAATLPEVLSDPASLEKQARAFAAEHGLSFGRFAKAARAVLTGRMATPPLFHCMCLLGHQETVRRLTRAPELVKQAQSSGNGAAH